MFITFKIKFKELSADNLVNIRKSIIDISLHHIKEKMQNQSVEYDEETQQLMIQYDTSIEEASMSDESRTTLYKIVYAKMEEQTNQYNDFLQRELALWQSRYEEINSKHNLILGIL